MSGRPAWSLPEGVNAPLWRYANETRLAEEEDAYFLGHPLLALDQQQLVDRFREPGRLIDLGCGTGRIALEFAARGFEVVAIDLAHAMLKVLDETSIPLGPRRPTTIRANLCRLDFLPGGSFDYATSMFSTLGMIRGAAARKRALEETGRLLRAGGRLALHAHNLAPQIRAAEARHWLVRETLKAWWSGRPRPDRPAQYRGVAGIEVHAFTWPELRNLLVGSGFQIDEVIPLDGTSTAPKAPSRLATWTAGGWIIFATRRPS